MSPSWSPGPLPAESEAHNHPAIQYCTQECPAYTARPQGFPSIRARCVWCGALPIRRPDGRIEWAIQAHQAECDHELLEGPS